MYLILLMLSIVKTYWNIYFKFSGLVWTRQWFGKIAEKYDKFHDNLQKIALKAKLLLQKFDDMRPACTGL